MNYFKFTNNNIVCFREEELKTLFENAKGMEILEEMQKRKVSFDDLRKDKQKIWNIANTIGSKTAEDKNDHEIFAVLYGLLRFFEKNSQICFELKNNFDIKKQIKNLTDLKKVRKENTLSDFIIKSKGGFSQFQLKRYRNKPTTNDLLKFIKSKLSHYCNNLGDTSLLIALQSKEEDISKIDFYKINEEIKKIDLKSNAQILISYNESNKFEVLNQVYPELARHAIPYAEAGL
jgi:hypothetical protein